MAHLFQHFTSNHGTALYRVQVLLSRENLGKRSHYTNALNTFRELLRLGVIPIVNENDTVRARAEFLQILPQGDHAC